MVTIAEAARELGVTPRTVQHRISTGEMAADKITPRFYMIPRAELDRWKAIGKRKGGRPRKEPTIQDVAREDAEHLELLEESRRRIRGETD